MKYENKAQIAIFIILALIIIVLIILLFLLIKPPELEVMDENNPQASIESCTREAVEEALGILSPRGGDIDPKGKVLYDNIDRAYLCYTEDYYERQEEFYGRGSSPRYIEGVQSEVTRELIHMIIHNAL